MKKLLAIALLLCVCLSAVSCMPTSASSELPKDPTDLKEKMEGKGYEVFVWEDSEDIRAELSILDLPSYGATVVVGAVDKEDEENIVIAIYYRDAESANDAYDQLKENWDDLMDWLDRENPVDFRRGKSGNVVYLGDKGAVEDALAK